MFFLLFISLACLISPTISSDTFTANQIAKETQWSDSNESSTSSPLRFPRKAAFFTLIGAEAMTRCQCVDAAERASSLYLAASHLYSRKGNIFEHGDDTVTRYGWATLRTAALQGLSSQPADKEVAEAGEFYRSGLKTSGIYTECEDT